MPGYFWITFDSLRSLYPGALALELVIEQDTRRVARISSAEFELWLVSGSPDNIGHFLAPLRFDIRSDLTDSNAQLKPEFRDHQKSRCRLLWHYTPEQLQRIEDCRKGGNVVFHIYAQLFVASVWPSPDEKPRLIQEIEAPGHQGGWPLRVEIAESEWIQLLGKVGFRHPVMHRLTWPALPPAFSRAEAHLNQAWDYYRHGDPPGAMASCYKAFECLGFDLFGKDATRKQVSDLLMDGADQQKQEAVLATLKSLQMFFQLGRHDKSAPVKLTHRDAEMAVLCATTLLAYLANPSA